MTKRFQDAMRLMRAADPSARKNGFQLLRDHVTEHTDELIAEFERDGNDHGLRCWLLELIGETKSESVFPLLAARLRNSDEAFRWRCATPGTAREAGSRPW